MPIKYRTMPFIDRALCLNVFPSVNRRCIVREGYQRRGCPSTLLELVPVRNQSPTENECRRWVIIAIPLFFKQMALGRNLRVAWVWARPLSQRRMDGTAPRDEQPFQTGSGLLKRNVAPCGQCIAPASGDNAARPRRSPIPSWVRSVTMPSNRP